MLCLETYNEKAKLPKGNDAKLQGPNNRLRMKVSQLPRDVLADFHTQTVLFCFFIGIRGRPEFSDRPEQDPGDERDRDRHGKAEAEETL